MSSQPKDKLLSEVDGIKIVKANSEGEPEEDEQFQCNQVTYGDAMFSCFVVAPQVVSVWRGTWGIMELNAKLFPYAETYILGIVIHISFALIRSQLLVRSKSKPANNSVRWLYERILSRIYTYIFILSNIMHWRGGWGLFDATVVAIIPDDKDPHRPVVIAALVILIYLAATILRSSKNILASPYFLVTDGKEATYIFTTRFQSKEY
ncbi:uncharacterized protein LOC121739451 [Aricia agestis]|uniref:uncharacterized protein LOC121739451 n=1 Tax=Aricia agestis TaxID=91739 RepID=UPI001C20AAEB|nr:uncharacterized protein LOC121739451 [Aricia agestis]